MDIVTKKPSLLKSSLLIALALNLTALPAINATADMINQTPSESIPNFDQLTAEQSDIESIRHQVEQTLSSMPLNTERLKQAASYFKAKDDDKARAVLDSIAIAQEQNLLLAQLAKQPELQAQLDDKATELILLAMLTAIDAKLGDQRMAKANQYFEQALKSGRSAGYLYQYALFADNTNQTEHADKLFTEALAAQRKLANDNPENLTFMITLLDRLGTVKLNLSQYDAGYALYTEALALSLKLITLEPKASSTLSTTLNSMWVITRADPKRSNDIVKLYEQTIATLRRLTVSAPEVYLATLANALTSLAALLDSNQETARQAEVDRLYTEALSIYRKLALTDPETHLPEVATTLSNLGATLLSNSTTTTTRRSDIQTYLTEALSLNRQLANTHPDPYLRRVYQSDVIRTLEMLGRAHIKWQEPQQAQVYLQEAMDLVQPLAAAKPDEYTYQIANLKDALSMIK